MPRTIYRSHLHLHLVTAHANLNCSWLVYCNKYIEFKILGLNPADPQDWITAFLTVVITVTGLDIVSGLIRRLITQLSSTPINLP